MAYTWHVNSMHTGMPMPRCMAVLRSRWKTPTCRKMGATNRMPWLGRAGSDSPPQTSFRQFV
jgi:hypothetical protein